MVNQENVEGFESQSSKPEPLNVQLLYANVVSVGLTLTDVHLTAAVNGRPAIILAIPLPTAKTLAIALQTALNQYQSVTKQEILDLPQLSALLKYK
jgi:hypothetical protein